MNTHTIASVLGSACLTAGLALALSGCATTGRFDGPDGDRRLYEARCGFCHVPFAPRDFHPDDWPGLVANMSARAGLTADLRERVTRYVVAGSRSAWESR